MSCCVIVVGRPEQNNQPDHCGMMGPAKRFCPSVIKVRKTLKDPGLLKEFDNFSDQANSNPILKIMSLENKVRLQAGE